MHIHTTCAWQERLYPDANSTLRLSAGRVEGYHAADACYHSPITTLGGLVDKADRAALAPVEYTAMRGGGGGAGGGNEFECPANVRARWEERGRDGCGGFGVPVPGGGGGGGSGGGAGEGLDVAVNICYSTDTVGGNSGSPVMNAKVLRFLCLASAVSSV